MYIVLAWNSFVHHIGEKAPRESTGLFHESHEVGHSGAVKVFPVIAVLYQRR
jgi:hypothetical protein